MDTCKLQGALASTARVSEIARRDMFIPEAARGNDNTLWVTMGSCIRVLTRTYGFTDHPKPIQLFEVEIRDVWYLFILAAKNIDAHHPGQDRLTRLILWARELGIITRTLKSSQMLEKLEGEEGKGESDDLVVQEALTSNGRIWTDLPFMVQDVQDAWKSVMSPDIPSYQRCNLAAAVARLAGLGVLDEAFSGCGLDIMRLTLETPPSVATRPDFSGQDESSHITEADGSIPLSDLLPLVRIWLHFAGDKLLRLCLADKSGNEDAWNEGAFPLGPLARDAKIDIEGFSQPRFFFWKKRLQDLKEYGDELTEELAAASSNNMNMIWDSFFGLR